MLFAAFPYDYPLLWTTRPVPAAYYDQLEAHLRFMFAAPPLISRLLHIAMFIALVGFALKLGPRPGQANFLFDGAALILFMIGMGVYFSNIVTGLRAVRDQPWLDEENIQKSTVAATAGLGAGDGTATPVLGREDTFRLVSISNTILALVLVGVLVLQSGQWYSERKENDELDKIAAERKESRAGHRRKQ
jgi:hypothetical protein